MKYEYRLLWSDGLRCCPHEFNSGLDAADVPENRALLLRHKPPVQIIEERRFVGPWEVVRDPSQVSEGEV